MARALLRPRPTRRRRRTREATLFLEALLYRRYDGEAPLRARFWANFAEEGGHSPRGYAECITEATGFATTANYLSDMDGGFYSADYLRAWIRSAQLRAHLPARGRRRLVAQPRHWRDPARLLRRGHEADERGDGRPVRLRPARHGPARRGSVRGVVREENRSGRRSRRRRRLRGAVPCERAPGRPAAEEPCHHDHDRRAGARVVRAPARPVRARLAAGARLQRPAVASETAEGDIPGNITVVVFLARKPGTTTVVRSGSRTASTRRRTARRATRSS